MSGVIDEDGQQWERCNGCARFVRFEELKYEQPTTRFRYGRDLCRACWPLSRANPGCPIELDPETVRLDAEAKRKIDESMRGKKWAFKDNADGSTSCYLVDIN
jgi:hypothetical protein